MLGNFNLIIRQIIPAKFSGSNHMITAKIVIKPFHDLQIVEWMFWKPVSFFPRTSNTLMNRRQSCFGNYFHYLWSIIVKLKLPFLAFEAPNYVSRSASTRLVPATSQKWVAIRRTGRLIRDVRGERHGGAMHQPPPRAAGGGAASLT